MNVALKKKVEDFKAFLDKLAEEFNCFDKENQSPQDRYLFIKQRSKEIFPYFNDFFIQIWEMVKDKNGQEYKDVQGFYQEKLGSPLLEAEINKYIKDRPLGYAGDFVTMNYIYDFHDKFLGSSSLDMLINNYTTNIPISNSNIIRKDYFKQKIKELSSRGDNPLIASIGCGSARELIELIKEGQITGPITFTCVDLEGKALDYVRKSMEAIDKEKQANVNIQYAKVDIRDLVKNERLQAKIGRHDFIYASGLMDYLQSKMIKKIISVLLQNLKSGGQLIVVNAGTNDAYFRSYYELLGGWEFIHRSEAELREWVDGQELIRSYSFEQFDVPMNYMFLLINKVIQ
jgi:2-polyprenyl-3-methyl-5-hydroxy-6-metoxy-1,4-benzoquinol methylase